MCNRIVEWNTRTYSSTTANCQLFVSDLLSAMGISLQLGGALGTFPPPPITQSFEFLHVNTKKIQKRHWIN